MRHVQAFYYNGEYYALPEGAEWEPFRRSFEQRGESRHLLRMDRVHCLPPWFVEEECTLTELYIEEPEHMFPAAAELMSRAEYDDRLHELVKAKCPGCKRFGGNADDLTGHHEEMPLDGACILREDDPSYCFRAGVHSAWLKLVKVEDNLRRMIDLGGYEAAEDCIREAVRPHFGPLAGCMIAVEKVGERYALMFSGQGSSVLRLYMDFIVRMAPEEFTAHWDVYSYLPRGVYQYRPATCDIREAPPQVKVTRDLYDRPRLEVTLLVQPSGEEGAAPHAEAYRWACHLIGEDRMLAAVVSLSYQDKRSEGFAPMQLLVDEVDCLLAELGIDGDAEESYQVRYMPRTRKGRLLRGGSGQTVVTRSLEISNLLVMNKPNDLLEHLTEDMNTPLMTIALDLPAEAEDFGAECSWLLNTLAAPLTETDCGKLAGYAIGGERMYLDLILTHRKQGLMHLRELAPILMAYNAQIGIRAPGGQYSWHRGDWAMTPMDGPMPADRPQ